MSPDNHDSPKRVDTNSGIRVMISEGGSAEGYTTADLIAGLLAAIVFIAAGVAMISFGIYLHKKSAELRARGVVAQGTIIRFERRETSTGSRRDTLSLPVVTFVTADGREITFEGSMEDNPWTDLHAGKRVEVIYDPKDPTNARINTFAEFWFGPLMLWAIGGCFIVIPPFTLWRHFRRRPRGEKEPKNV